MPDISVIISAYNKAFELLFCLTSLTQQNIPKDRFEVVLVDDYSTDATIDVIKEFTNFLNLKYIRLNDGPSGLARVRNVGSEVASGPVLIFLDADIVVCNDFIAAHLRAHAGTQYKVNLGYLYAVGISDKIWLRTSKIVGILKPLLHFIGNYNTFGRLVRKVWLHRFWSDSYWTFFNWPRAPIAKWDFSNNINLFKRAEAEQVFPDLRVCWIKKYGELMMLPAPWTTLWGGNFSIHKTFLQKVGLFDERFVQYGSEDLELGYRLHASNANFQFDINAKGFHYPHPRDTNQNKKSERLNNGYFLRKHPTLDVEMHSTFGCYNVNHRLLELATLSQNEYYPLCHHSLFKVWNSFKHDDLEPCLVIGCGDGTILGLINATCGLEINYSKFINAQKSPSSHTIYWLLGVATPFADKSFASVLIVDIWRFLTDEMRCLLLREALRLGNHVFLLKTRHLRRDLRGSFKRNRLKKNLGQSISVRYKEIYCTDDYELIEVELIRSKYLETNG